MTSITTAVAEQEFRIIVTAVNGRDRVGFLPHYLGRYFMKGEALIYATMDSLCSEYDGGLWDFFALSNHGFYMAPQSQAAFQIECVGNGFSGKVSADAAGIIACLYALNYLACSIHENDHFIEMYYRLREYAAEHPENRAIFQAID
jgi:hypothetical protein